MAAGAVSGAGQAGGGSPHCVRRHRRALEGQGWWLTVIHSVSCSVASSVARNSPVVGTSSHPSTGAPGCATDDTMNSGNPSLGWRISSERRPTASRPNHHASSFASNAIVAHGPRTAAKRESIRSCAPAGNSPSHSQSATATVSPTASVTLVHFKHESSGRSTCARNVVPPVRQTPPRSTTEHCRRR